MNLLFIVADQFRADHLSCLGHPAIHTPHLDRLAAEGVCFTNHWANASPCGPSRACLLTGTYMSQHRSVRNGFPIAPGIGNLAQDLRALGLMPTVFGYTSTSPDPASIPFGQSEWHSYHHILPGFCEGIHLRDAMENWRDWMNQQGVFRQWRTPTTVAIMSSGDRGRQYLHPRHHRFPSRSADRQGPSWPHRAERK